MAYCIGGDKMLSDQLNNALFEFFGESNRVLFELQDGTRPKELTTIQYNIVEYLFFKEGVTLSDVSACMYLSMPNASREVRKLADKGYVVKRQDKEDKRKHTILLSDDGRQLMSETFAKICHKSDARYRDLSDTEKGELIQAMALLKEKLFF